MDTWLISDWHLGESRFDLMQRSFKTVQEMIDLLLSNHNELVKPTDLVYVVGDVCYQKAPEFLNRVSDFHGRKILLRGNHDRVFTDEQLSPYFEQIIPEGRSLDIEFNGIPLSLNHYPSLAKSDRFNLVGHVHSAWKFQLNSVNLSVDVQNYIPVNLNQIPFFIQAISEFYDDDVWAAYLPANADYREQRGKKGNYFSPQRKE